MNQTRYYSSNWKPGFIKKFNSGQFFCHSCQYACASQNDLDLHYLSVSHLSKAYRMLESGVTSLKGRWATGNSITAKHFSVNGTGGIHIPSVHYGNHHHHHRSTTTNQQPPVKKPRGDFSNYRLPSGKFYCSMCNQTVNNESEIASHVESKRHKSAYAAMKTEQEVAELAKK